MILVVRRAFLRCVMFAVIGGDAPDARAAGATCEDSIRRIETSSAHMGDCRGLREAADGLRSCTRGASSDEPERLETARWEASVALRRCTCAEVPAATELSRRAASLASPFDLAIVELMVDHAEQCASETSATERRALAEVRARVRQSRAARAYCRGPSIDWRAVANATVQTCDDARLQTAALSHWNACPAASTDDRSLRKTLEHKAALACVSALGSSAKAPDCDILLATANRLRQRSTGDDPRLWNLIATQAIAASGAQATTRDRSCAARMMANDTAADRVFVESILQDPDLRKRLLPALRRAFKDSTVAKDLVGILETGTDIRAVIEKASTLSADKQRLFFSIVGAVGRMAEAARAVSAYEQNARAFDLVVAPEAEPCANGRSARYEDFSHVFVAGFLSAEPANVVFEKQTVDQRRVELLASRTRSCGTAATDPAAGPGCGAVISLQLDRRGPDRAAGTVKLQFVVPGDEGRAVTSETTIAIPEFADACGTSSEEVAAASRIAHGVLFKFARPPGDTVVVKDRPVPVEICGLRAIPPDDSPTTRFDHKGIRIEVPQGDPKLAGPATGARAAMQA